jgi:hypothetical protein
MELAYRVNFDSRGYEELFSYVCNKNGPVKAIECNVAYEFFNYRELVN